MSQTHQDHLDITVQEDPINQEREGEGGTPTPVMPPPPVYTLVKRKKADRLATVTQLKKQLNSQNWPDWSYNMTRMLWIF